ncbi:hypothetical protein [Hoeflea sp.]|uniref:hypothetical protein n=1 Tax=Hoeflea sp. TaxID=1940281 RepID=UPI003B01496E
MNTLRFPAFVLAAAFLAAAPGWADSTGARNCPQALAGYGTPEQSVLLEFAGSADLSFSLLIEGQDGRLDGFVYPAEEEDGMAGVVLDDCPEGDVTGAQLEACTVWQGAVHGVDTDGDSGPLPASDQPAAGLLKLDGLYSAVKERAPDMAARLPDEPIDTLTLLACLE